MKFKAKSIVQRVVACLPDPVSDRLYYFIQRRWGRLQQVDPIPHFRQAIRLINLSRAYWPSNGPVVLEVGTGRTLNVPFGLWLAGASKIITFDLNSYLRPELIEESLASMRKQESRIVEMFRLNGTPLDARRFESLLSCRTSADAILLAGIEYYAPADATLTSLPNSSIDLHVSVNVLEHIPPAVITRLLVEASRVLKPSGRLAHVVDPSDHFAHTDPSLNKVNFLRYSSAEWQKIAGNKFMYQNRLRATDYLQVLKKSGFTTEEVFILEDANALKAIKAGFAIHSDFARYTPNELATTELVFRARLDSW